MALSMPIREATPDARLAAFAGVDLRALAERFGTPLHVLSFDSVRSRVEVLQASLHGLDTLICYAVKANANLRLLNRLGRLGVGADIVSGGELQRCLHAGIPPERIVFSGVGKSAEEIRLALEVGIARFNVESRDELGLINLEALRQGLLARVALRINPDVDAHTHAKISTGKAENKFGIAIDEARLLFADAERWPALRIDGLHMHIGSQLLQLDPIREAMRRLAELQRALQSAGHRIASIDVGGGLGVGYRAGKELPISIQRYADVLREHFADFDGRLILEPGRHLVAEAGVLLTRVLRIKPGRHRQFLILDAAMTELIRPSLYDAWHEIVPLTQSGGDSIYDVVGPVCESGDTFAIDRRMPRCQVGDVVAITCAGAYAASMASNYNSRPLAAEVMIESGEAALMRRRQSFEEMTLGEVI